MPDCDPCQHQDNESLTSVAPRRTIGQMKSFFAWLVRLATLAAGSASAGAPATNHSAPPHPSVYLTRADIGLAKTNISQFAWARATADSIQHQADAWLAKPDDWFLHNVPSAGACFAYGFTGCPICGASWGTWAGVKASFDQPGCVTCAKGHTLPDADHPDSGTGWVGQDKRVHYFVGSYNAWAVETLTFKAADNLAYAYTLTGDERYAAKASLILDALAAIYPSCDKGSWDYPSHPPSGRFDRPWYQVARVLVHYVDQYDQIFGSPALAEEVQRNIANLAKFKQHLSRNLRATFRNPDDLRRQIESALGEWRGEAPTVKGDPAKYLDSLRKETAFIDIRGLQVGTGKAYRFPIEDLYIPLTTAADPGARGELALREPVRLEDALKHPRLVITGDPGAGKTTFLRHIAFKMCDDLTRATAARLPILVRIAELAEHVRACRHRREGPTVAAAPGWLPHWLAAPSAEFRWGLDAPFFERKLQSGVAAVLLDGLDEAPNRTEREAMARLLENATRAYDKCSFVVTTRPLAYQGQAVLADFETANIAPLEPQAIDTFLERWCAALFSENPASSASHLAELRGALRARAEIRRMARNPVMLTALAVVHWNERRLPEQRADLYESILIWLARSREQRPDRPTAERCLMLLQQLALAMQTAPRGRAVQGSKGWGADALAPHFREV